mgnify:FL=1|jgi:hypothetical protein
MAITYNPFESDYGFKSPGFSVDINGNVTLRSVTYTLEQEEAAVDNQYVVRQLGAVPSAEFTMDEQYVTGTQILQNNPTLTLTRGTTYSFKLMTLPQLTFSLFFRTDDNPVVNLQGIGNCAYYNDGVSHTTSGTPAVTTTGEQAQTKANDVTTLNLSPTAPANIYYGNADGSVFGTINTVDPTITGVGSFSSLLVTGDVTMQGQDADLVFSPQGAYGTVTINPAGEGTMSNMNVNALTMTASENVTFNGADANLTLTPTGTGAITLTSAATGTINNMSIGQTTPKDGSFVNLNASSGLNNTVIGDVTPKTATFTSAVTQATPTTELQITNKKYVDSKATALAIALGV